MIPDEAGRKSFELLADALGLDEFQRIAILAEYENVPDGVWPPKPGSDHERALMNIGAIVSERL